ncbi:MAG TPA: hypothetical protein VFJ85_17745 [Acidimicrobiales bacterium]|nr:hypothetical protein [Acidimicrobiales bacterium]
MDMTDPEAEAGEGLAANGRSASSFYDAGAPPFEERPLQSTREEAATRAADAPPGEASPALGGRGPLPLVALVVAGLAVLLLIRRRRRRRA